MSVFFFILWCAGGGPGDESITRSQKSYQVRVCLTCVISKPQKCGDLGPNWVVAPQRRIIKYCRLVEAKDLRHSERHLLFYFTDTLSACCAVETETTQHLPWLEHTLYQADISWRKREQCRFIQMQQKRSAGRPFHNFCTRFWEFCMS